MSDKLSKYVVSTVKAIGYDIEEHVNQHGITHYALTYNGFLHSDWLDLTEIEAFAHGVSRALHCVGGEWRINKALDEIYEKEQAEKAKRCVDPDEKFNAAEGKEHQCCCGKYVEGNIEYTVLEGQSAFDAMFSDAMAVFDELEGLMEKHHKRTSDKDE